MWHGRIVKSESHYFALSIKAENKEILMNQLIFI